MVRPIKKKQIANLQDAIKETAWKQIAEFGVPALSLRAIARELKITAPAIYNYFPDRDALVTALVIDAFTSFGDHQLEARDKFPQEQIFERFHAIGVAYRQWALTYPQRYELIFGTPIPGYEPPMMEILPSSARSISALASVIDDLRKAGMLNADNFPVIKFPNEECFLAWKSFAGDFDILSLSVSMLVWSRVHGLVSLEIGGGLPPFDGEGNALYLYELDSIRKQFVRERNKS